MHNSTKGTIVFDFDGVVHLYREGWKDGSIYDDHDKRIVQIMSALMHEGYSVAIMSTRKPSTIVEWCSGRNLFPVTEIPEKCTFWEDKNRVGVTNRKIPALLYIDDRAFLYRGNISLDAIFNSISLLNIGVCKKKSLPDVSCVKWGVIDIPSFPQGFYTPEEVDDTKNVPEGWKIMYFTCETLPIAEKIIIRMIEKDQDTDPSQDKYKISGSFLTKIKTFSMTKSLNLPDANPYYSPMPYADIMWDKVMNYIAMEDELLRIEEIVRKVNWESGWPLITLPPSDMNMKKRIIVAQAFRRIFELYSMKKSSN